MKSRCPFEGQLLMVLGLIALITFRPANAQPAASGAQRGVSPAATNSISYKRYVNARFKYAIDYPSTLIPGPESENGDGRKFKSRDGQTELTAYGMSAYATVDGNKLTIANALKEELAARDQNGDYVSYKATGKSWMVLSGYSGNKIFYYKLMISKDSVKVFELRYSDQQKRHYDPVVAHIAASFKNTQ